MTARSPDYLAMVASHLRRVVDTGRDVYGPRHTAMWMASLDTNTGAFPEGRPKANAGQRVYREIAAPRGSTIYWDQPALAAAHAVSRITGDDAFAAAADDYVRDFLAVGIDGRGLLEWGNHRYYDCFTDEIVRFTGGDHEMRPLPGAWELFWRIDPAVVERAIRALRLHLVDPETGQFNRHDTDKPGCAFLEAGGILVESLCWLAGKTGDRSPLELARKIAGYSWGHRNPAVGLPEVNPAEDRWDKYVCTTEVGLWAGSLLRAADYADAPDLSDLAAAAAAAYLSLGWDDDAGRYFGQLRVADGSPARGIMDGPDPWPYQPADHSDIFNAMFPTHDYPMALAQSAVELHRRTGDEIFAAGIERWAGVIAESPAPTTARDGRGGYAECFGRAVHFLATAADATGQSRYVDQARALAEQACEILYTGEMFRSHAGEDRCDAVDGVGILMLALLRLHTGEPIDGMGFGF